MKDCEGRDDVLFSSFSVVFLAIQKVVSFSLHVSFSRCEQAHPIDRRGHEHGSDLVPD